MPRSDNKDIAEFQKLLREVIQKKSVSKAPLIRELQNRKRSKSKSKSSVKSVRSRARARSVKKGKPRRRRSSQQQAGAVRDGSHQKFPRCR
tara:strand:+ start:257 stop:529 length:273 start_codon:yes stop_codon:yes gene_type:complete